MGECRNRAERVSLEIPFYFRNYPQQFPEALDGNPLFLQAGYGQPMYIATSSAWWSKRAAKSHGGGGGGGGGRRADLPTGQTSVWKKNVPA